MRQKPRIKQGIQFIQTDQINGQLCIIGDDDAASLLWAAQWLDAHREYIITDIQFENSANPRDEADLTATVTISLTHVSIQVPPLRALCDGGLMQVEVTFALRSGCLRAGVAWLRGMMPGCDRGRG